MNGILIEGAAINAKIEIYSFIGQMVYSSPVTHNIISLTHLSRGFYIVRVDNHVEKFIW
jgi:hypothetical protein